MKHTQEEAGRWNGSKVGSTSAAGAEAPDDWVVTQVARHYADAPPVFERAVCVWVRHRRARRSGPPGRPVLAAITSPEALAAIFRCEVARIDFIAAEIERVIAWDRLQAEELAVLAAVREHEPTVDPLADFTIDNDRLVVCEARDDVAFDVSVSDDAAA